MEKSFKYRIYPTEAQAEQIEKTFGCCRYTYNHYLAASIASHNEGKPKPAYFDKTRT